MRERRDDSEAAVERLYDRVRHLSPRERETFLDGVGDADVRAELRELLRHESAAAELFDRLESRVRVPPAEAFDPSVTPGERVGRYEVVEVLGRGGMGVVYRARDRTLGRAVALKLLHRWRGADPAAVRRFVDEARAASAIDHPNIATVYEIGEADDGAPYIAMACYEGETLAGRLERGPLPPDEAANVVRQAAAGLAAAHGAGIVHRDVKPANLFLVAGGPVKVLDFGVAKIVGADATRTGADPGTPAYMAPEQARGERVDGRADVWSLGVVLHEALTGRRPFAGGRPEAVVRAILDDEPPPPDPPEGSCPPGLARIVGRALEKDPADRHPDAAALEADLAAWETPGAHAPDRAPRRPGRRASVIAGAVVLALIVFAGAGLWWRGAPEPAAPPPVVATAPDRVVVLPFEVRGSPEFDYLGEGLAHLLGTSLDGAASLRSVDPRAVLDRLHASGPRAVSPAEAGRVAEGFGAERFVLGTVVEVAGRLRIQAALYPRETSSPLARAQVEGDVARLFDLVDEIASQLLVADRPAAGLTRVAAITTQSIEAFKAYLEGDRARRDGRFDAAVDGFRRAVEEDSLFALAHYQLSKAAAWTRRRDLARDAAERAARHAGPLAPQVRDLLTAHRAYWRGDMPAAERLYRSALVESPENADAWYELGEVLFHSNPQRGRSRAEAREAFERTLALDPAHGEPLVHLLDLAAFDGDTARFAELYGRLAVRGEVPLEWRALRSVVLGDAADRRAIEAEIAAATEPDAYRAAIRTAVAGRGLADVAAFLETAADGARTAEWRAAGLLALAQVELGRGRVEAAGAALERLRHVDPANGLEHGAVFGLHPALPASVPRLEALRDTLRAWDPATASSPGADHAGLHAPIRRYLLGLLSARLGDLDAARGHAAALAAVPAGGDAGRVAAAFAASVRAHAAWHSGRVEVALEHLADARMGATGRERRSPLLAGALESFVRAELLRLIGRDEAAAEWYGAAGDYGLTQLPYLAPSLLRRADIAERAGDGAGARAGYARFAETWAEADPELRAMVRRAKERIVALDGDR